MPTYIKFTNKGTMSRKFLELIGATDKRTHMSDASVIGNKGSGAKFAPVPALRLGYEVAVTSTDDKGNFLLNYEKEKVVLSESQEIEQIVFNYIGSSRFPSQLTLDALRDWDQPVGEDDKKIFKALREYVCNAWDADKDFTTEIVEEMTPALPGTSAAYLSLTPEIEEILNYSSRYIKFIKKEKALYSDELYGNIYPKSEPGVTRLFCQGVLVDCKKSEYYSSIFDYSLNDKWLLSEERIIKDFNVYMSHLANFLVNIDNIQLVIKLMSGLMNETAELEGDALKKVKHIPYDTQEMYSQAWHVIYGEKAIIGIGSNQADNDARNKGYTVVESVPYFLGEFLKKCGIKTSKDFATIIKKSDGEKMYELITLSPEQQEMYDEAHRIFLKYFPQGRLLPVIFFKSENWLFNDSLGHCGTENRRFKEIWIKDAALVSVGQILHVLVHEGRHCFTNAGDYDRKFIYYADEILVKWMVDDNANDSIVTWGSRVISKRGLQLPKRFIGFKANLAIMGTEILLTLRRDNCDESYKLTSTINYSIMGSCVRQQTVSRFNKTNFGTVHLPEKILTQLPEEILFQIADVTPSQSIELV